MTKPKTDITSKRLRLQERAAEDVVADYLDYRQAVLTDGDVDDKRKLVDLQVRLIGAEADRRASLNDHLPVFNFVFTGGQVQMQVQTQPKPLEQVEVVEAVEAAEPLSALPSPEPDELLSALDAELGLDLPELR